MFGALRLFLAMAVAFSHMGVPLGGYHPGVAAVVCFYAISGYAMTGLVSSTYSRVPQNILAFYRDRILRLGPQYYFYLAVCAVTVFVFNWRHHQPGPPDALNIFANLAVIPLNFHMFSQSISNLILNIPTWTIGLELIFYLLLPFLLMSRAVLWVTTAVGAAAFAAATHGVLHPDFYAYRLLPGVLVFFAIGIALQRSDRVLFGALATFFVANAGSLGIAGKLNLEWNASLLSGAAVALVALPLLSKLQRNSLDDRLGAASYGCYLAHWIFVTALIKYSGQPWAVATAVVGSALSGWLTYLLIEAPTVRFRHELRHRKPGTVAV